MKYPYMVNKNGVYYPAGIEVPEDKPVKVDVTDDTLDEQHKTKGGKKK